MSKKDKGYPWKKAKESPVLGLSEPPQIVPEPHRDSKPTGDVPLPPDLFCHPNALTPPEQGFTYTGMDMATEVLPAGEPFLALGVVKIGAHWHKVEIDCVLIDGKAHERETRVGNASVRAQAIAEFKQTAVRKRITS